MSGFFSLFSQANADRFAQSIKDAEDAKKNWNPPSMVPLKRFLQERSFLVFEFVKPGSGGGKQFSLLPFFENISISEEQRANYAVYDLIGRAGNIYGYMGAKSRQFKLSFKMNIKHINEMLAREGLSFSDFSPKDVNSDNNKEAKKLLFTRPQALFQDLETRKLNTLSEKASNNYLSLSKYDPNLINNYNKLRNKLELENLNLLNNIGNIGPEDYIFSDAEQNRISNATNNLIQRVDKINHYKVAVNLVMWWTNLVRTSTINNSKNSIYGPPIIRINHGLMYNNIPCICTNYSIKESNNTSYDVPNLMPHIIDINMSLEEIRVSEIEYGPGETNGDGLAGWNDLLKYKTMDPYNGIWGVSKWDI